MEGKKDPRLGHRYSKPGECPRCGAPLSAQKRHPRTMDLAGMVLLSDLSPVDGFRCPSCGRAFVVEELKCDETYVYDWKERFEFAANFCPSCGARVVSDGE